MVTVNFQPKNGAEFFAQSLVGETITELAGVPGGVVIWMASGLRALVKKAYCADLTGERIIGFEQEFPKTPKVLTLNFVSGRRTVIEI